MADRMGLTPCSRHSNSLAKLVGGKGIQLIAVVHGEAQLAERWGDHGRQVVLDTSSVKVFLPGITKDR
jgi:TraM recognition site of TraD and TraG